MKLHNPAHPSEILLDYFLSSPDFVVSSGKQTLVSSLILNKTAIDEEISDTLSGIFQTSKDFWLNMQKQWDQAQLMLGTDKPCPDVSKEVIMPLSAINHVIKTGIPTRTYLDEDKSNPVVVMSLQAYQYMLSKCTEDELWDLGFLGQSEEHAQRVDLPSKFKAALFKFKEKANLDANPGSFLQNDFSNGTLDLEDMNSNPTKYATHCLIADESQLIIESTDTCPQLLFIENSWQPSSIYSGILKPLI